MRISKALWIGVFLLLFSWPIPAANADEHYYLMIFGAQTYPNRARNTHTFGTFVKATPNAEGTNWNLEAVTISWMPASMVLRPLAFRPQPGVNLSLGATFDWALSIGASLSMWGPFEIQPGLYEKALARKAYLESGVPQFKLIDRDRRPWTLDCIHALSGVDDEPGRLHTRTAHGNIASYFDLQHFGRWIIHPELTHPWVAERLGIFNYPIRSLGFSDEPSSALPLLSPYYTDESPRLFFGRFRRFR